ncbi:MAG: N-acetylmuramoyl-L-alanine amidase [Bacteroidales bacterium]|nr:N-acetylmuramoyl-L-alanine amidase [Bacteroidales bacterium]
MKHIRIILTATLLLATLCDINAGITFRRARAYSRDTVTDSKYYLVCITDPGNLAAVNGQQVKVYKTGTFGKQLKLTEGDNRIEVTLFKGTEVETRELHVFYVPGHGITSRPAAAPQLEDRLFYVQTKELAYLQYGSGSDRLGGSKMGFLDPGIVLKVVGQIGDLYKVQLSANRYAFIHTEDVEFSPRSSHTVNTNNIGISNLDDRDRIRLSLPERLPYASRTSLDPTAITVEVFGAMNNSNWVTQYDELGMVDYVDLRQTESDVLQLYIKLKEKYSWGYSVRYDGNALVIEVKHSPKNLSLKGLTIGLDAGHGGDAPGAVSNTGLRESDVNMSIVRETEKLLRKKGAKVVLSRTDDSALTMPERKKIFLDAGIDLLVSVHNNAGGSPLSAMGTSTYFKHITNRDLAATLLRHMLELDVPNFGLTGNFNFSLNAPTEYPNALVECLFMSSLPDEEFLADPANHSKIAEKIVEGLEDYLGQVADSKGLPANKKKKK